MCVSPLTEIASFRIIARLYNASIARLCRVWISTTRHIRRESRIRMRKGKGLSTSNLSVSVSVFLSVRDRFSPHWNSETFSQWCARVTSETAFSNDDNVNPSKILHAMLPRRGKIDNRRLGGRWGNVRARVQVRRARRWEKKQADDVMVISTKRDATFIDLPGDSRRYCTMLGRVRPARVSTDDRREIGFRGIEPRGGKRREGQNR